jgi:hypothetical protein
VPGSKRLPEGKALQPPGFERVMSSFTVLEAPPNQRQGIAKPLVQDCLFSVLGTGLAIVQHSIGTRESFSGRNMSLVEGNQRGSRLPGTGI